VYFRELKDSDVTKVPKKRAERSQHFSYLNTYFTGQTPSRVLALIQYITNVTLPKPTSFEIQRLRHRKSVGLRVKIYKSIHKISIIQAYRMFCQCAILPTGALLGLGKLVAVVDKPTTCKVSLSAVTHNS